MEEHVRIEQLNDHKKLMKKTKIRLISFFIIFCVDIVLLIMHQSKPLFFFNFNHSDESIGAYGSYHLILWILLAIILVFLIGYVRLFVAYRNKVSEEAFVKAYNFFDLFSVVPIFFMVVMILTGWFVTTAIVSQHSMNDTYQENDLILINYHEPVDRDDVIVFEKDKLYIKRVIGLPGDHLVVNQEGVWINDEFIADIPLFYEDIFEYDTTIPEGSYFVLGDNRQVSIDSRYEEIGFVFEDDIIGGVMFEHEKSVIE